MADTSITREERYLEYLTGDRKGNVPKPVTRRERYLYDLCQKGISGLTPEEIENAVNKYLEGKDYVTKADADKAYQPTGSYLSGTDERLAVSGKAADAKAVGNAVAKIEDINYTDRGTLADTDAFMVNDGTGMKKGVLSRLSDFVLNKLADKTFQKLATSNKTIIGAINALYGNNVITEKLGSSIKDGYLTSALLIDVNGMYYDLNSKKFRVNKSVTSEMPAACTLGIRGVMPYDPNTFLAYIIEFHPVPGRIWTNKYARNIGWTGWKSITPA